MIESSSTGALESELRGLIAAMTPGDRLPSSRELVARHGVSPVTVTRAITALSAEGLVVVRPGAGTYVAQAPTPPRSTDLSWQSLALGDRHLSADGLSALFDPPQDGESISLGLGYLHPSLMPERLLATAWARAGRLPDAFHRPPSRGLSGLRGYFARRVGAGIEAHDVLIASGGQSAISAAVRAVVSPGEPLLVESPTYPGVIAIARADGIRPVPVPTDGDGLSPDALADAFARTGARAIYLQPTYQNPTGVSLATERRAQVLAVAAAAGAFVIEDDYARELSHGTRAPAPLITDDRDGRVIYVTSLTKSAAPSLRVSAIISRGAVQERIRTLRVVDDMYVPRPVQEAALELVSRSGWERHLTSLGEALRVRAETMVTAIRHHLPRVDPGPRPHGGLHIWAALPADVDDVEAARAARAGGVIVNPGRPFYPAEPPAPFLRLTFAAVADPSTIDEGLRRLARAVPALT